MARRHHGVDMIKKVYAICLGEGTNKTIVVGDTSVLEPGACCECDDRGEWECDECHFSQSKQPGVCRRCSGSGKLKNCICGATEIKCPDCGGTGKCSGCGGTGKIICENCEGSGSGDFDYDDCRFDDDASYVICYPGWLKLTGIALEIGEYVEIKIA